MVTHKVLREDRQRDAEVRDLEDTGRPQQEFAGLRVAVYHAFRVNHATCSHHLSRSRDDGTRLQLARDAMTVCSDAPSMTSIVRKVTPCASPMS